jgi:L-asparaginase/Glu-tRNA(Gln) amidotransferase subunit D
MTLYSHSLYQFTLLDNNILKNVWTEKTQTMTLEDFQEATQNHAGFVIEHSSLNLLVDTRNFKYRVPEENTAWTEKELNPRYHNIGVKKFAFIMPVEYLAYVKDTPSQDGKFATRYFADENEALTWLSE